MTTGTKRAALTKRKAAEEEHLVKKAKRNIKLEPKTLTKPFDALSGSTQAKTTKKSSLVISDDKEDSHRSGASSACGIVISDAEVELHPLVAPAGRGAGANAGAGARGGRKAIGSVRPAGMASTRKPLGVVESITRDATLSRSTSPLPRAYGFGGISLIGTQPTISSPGGISRTTSYPGLFRPGRIAGAGTDTLSLIGRNEDGFTPPGSSTPTPPSGRSGLIAPASRRGSPLCQKTLASETPTALPAESTPPIPPCDSVAGRTSSHQGTPDAYVSQFSRAVTPSASRPSTNTQPAAPVTHEDNRPVCLDNEELNIYDDVV